MNLFHLKSYYSVEFRLNCRCIIFLELGAFNHHNSVKNVTPLKHDVNLFSFLINSHFNRLFIIVPKFMEFLGLFFQVKERSVYWTHTRLPVNTDWSILSVFCFHSFHHHDVAVGCFFVCAFVVFDIFSRLKRIVSVCESSACLLFLSSLVTVFVCICIYNSNNDNPSNTCDLVQTHIFTAVIWVIKAK